MGQRIMTITIRVNLPDNATSVDQSLVAVIVEDAIDAALEKAGLERAVIGCDFQAPTRVEDLLVEKMPTIADLLDEEEED
jgi:PII-like signaling protein